MSWILLQQKQNDRIRFFTEDSEEYNTLRYPKFIEHIKNYTIIDRSNFLEEIDKYSIIFLDIKTGIWEIKNIENQDISKFTMNELYEANGVEVIETRSVVSNEKSSFEKIVDRAKLRIDDIIDFRKKEYK